MRALSAISLLLCSCCAHDRIWDMRGAQVIDPSGYVQPSDVETIEEATRDERGGNPRLDGLIILFVDDSLLVDGATAEGLFSPPRTIVVRRRGDCLAKSSLAHELWHYFNYRDGWLGEPEVVEIESINEHASAVMPGCPAYPPAGHS